MKIAGHTLGTPNHDLQSAFKLFHDVGLGAAEVVWQDGYRSSIPEDADSREVEQIRSLAEQYDIEFACITPYMKNLNSLDDTERDFDISRFQRCIETAQTLGAPWIRVYAGDYQPHESDVRSEKWIRLVDALKSLGEYAHKRGVTLTVENHFSTMAVSAAETVELMRAVDSPGVGILYDQANLVFTHQESYQEAIDLQKPWIRHVQVKDLVWVDESKPFTASAVANVSAEQRTVRSRVVGDGVIDWAGILFRLLESGYDGYLSLEYEYRWHPQDLPNPSEGFARGAEHLRDVLHNLGVDLA